MRIPEQTVKEILDKVRIEEIVSEYVTLTKKGDRYWGLSPFKPEKTPSFSVSPERNAYYCFSTQKGGGAVNFIMEMEHLTYPEALNFLAQKYGIEITAENQGLSDEYKNKKALLGLYQRLSTAFSHLLATSPSGTKAMEYLHSRGINSESVNSFKIGYVPEGEWLWNFLVAKKYAPDFLAQSGLFSKNHPRFSIFSGRLMFPIRDISGNTIAFGGRILGSDKGPKYINSPETAIYHKSSTVFGIDLAKDAIKRQGHALICEGYMDVVALHQAGINNAVAPLGTAFTQEQINLLKRLCSSVSLLFDNDQAGRKATEKALLLCEVAEMDCTIIKSEGEKDPADILLKGGSQALQKMVTCKVNALEYLIDQFKVTDSIANPEGVARLVNNVMPIIRAMQSPVKREGAMRLLADVLGYGMEAIRQEFSRANNDTTEPRVQANSKNRPAAPGTELGAQLLDLRIMLAVGLNCSLFMSLRSSLRLEDLKDARAREIYISLEECFRCDRLGFEALLEQIQDEELKTLLKKKQVEGEFSIQSESFVRSGVLRIRERNLVERRNSIMAQLRKLSHQTGADARQERELLEETLIIDEAVKELRKQIDDRSAE